MKITANSRFPAFPTDVVSASTNVHPSGNVTSANVSPYVAVTSVGNVYSGFAFPTLISTSNPLTIS